MPYALVAGGSKGIGYAIAEALAKRKYNLILIGRHSTKKDTQQKLGWFGEQMAVDPKKVGEIAVRRTLNKRLIIVPGTLAKIMSVVLRSLPRRLLVFIYDKAGEK